MLIYYENTDITDIVEVRECLYRDTSGNRCDSLDIVFENAASWYSMGPKEDDRIVISHNGYHTGIMYVNTILPENGHYRIFATSLPCAARSKGYQSFAGKSLYEIMRICAAGSGMDSKMYGIDGGIVIPYIQRENESYAAFLHRLLKLEGAALKCINGSYTAIGYEYAEARAAHQTIEVVADQSGMEYRRSGQALRTLTIKTPLAFATAEDTSVPEKHSSITLNEYPARDNIQAGRWARNLLRQMNRQCESLYLPSEFNAGYDAMTRIDITGSNDAAGEWLIEETTHDFINLRSTAKMHRCNSTIR